MSAPKPRLDASSRDQASRHVTPQFDAEADAIGSYFAAIAEIGRRVKAGEEQSSRQSRRGADDRIFREAAPMIPGDQSVGIVYANSWCVHVYNTYHGALYVLVTMVISPLTTLTSGAVR